MTLSTVGVEHKAGYKAKAPRRGCAYARKGPPAREGFQRIWRKLRLFLIEFPIFILPQRFPVRTTGIRHVPSAPCYRCYGPFPAALLCLAGIPRERDTALSSAVQLNSTLRASGLRPVLGTSNDDKKSISQKAGCDMHFIILLLKMCPIEILILVLSKICIPFLFNEFCHWLIFFHLGKI